MTINVPLLRRTLEYATEHPEETDLGAWAYRTPCGTVACIAARAVILAGYEIEGDSDRMADGRCIRDVAQEILGLSLEQDRMLFFCTTIDQAWEVAEHITDGDIQRPIDD